MGIKDYTGQKIGHLTVLHRAADKFSGGKRRTMWYCECDCVNHSEVVVSADYLKRSKSPSCGCEATNNRVKLNRKNNIGDKYGRLTIVDILWDNTRTKAVCRCDCGNIYTGVKADITSGHTQSCGCLQRDMASVSNTKDWAGYVSRWGVELLCQDHKNKSGQWVWRCRCGICGSEFFELPAKIHNGHVTSCGCRIQSAGEELIANSLTDMNIKFISQYTFENCKNRYVLRFDFGVIDSDGQLLGLIEYDGQQHFRPIDFFGGEESFCKTQENDKIKNEYCDSHNIPLLRIPYTLDRNEIQSKLYEYYLSVTTAGCI